MLGHIWKAVTAPVDAATQQEQTANQQVAQQVAQQGAQSATPQQAAAPAPGVPLHRSVQEQETVSPDGRVILRRTTIEEVEIRQMPPEQDAGPIARQPVPPVLRPLPPVQ